MQEQKLRTIREWPVESIRARVLPAVLVRAVAETRRIPALAEQVLERSTVPAKVVQHLLDIDDERGRVGEGEGRSYLTLERVAIGFARLLDLLDRSFQVIE